MDYSYPMKIHNKNYSNMPKITTVHIPILTEQPDCCDQCPLIGLVPKWRLSHGSQETRVCIATRHAMTARKARSKRSEADAKHPRHRYCDDKWDIWRERGFYSISKDAYSQERVPWEESQQLPIIFHEKRGPKPKK